jgi:hypothetical protein
LSNGEGARFVADEPQCKIQALAVPGVTVVGNSHGCSPLQFMRFWAKKNLTEINHKVSVFAKGLRRLFSLASQGNARADT